ncbi:hypothetical protein PINS_up003254 [Pythium insidiosum]|nr:hypothetical protein PINS_up003254 [Pythium insidiosum]
MGAQQLINSGVISVEDYRTLNGDLSLLDVDGTEETFEVELNDEEPTFLRGQPNLSREMASASIVHNPDGSIQRTTMPQSRLAKEQCASIDQLDSHLNRPWEDSMPHDGERHVAQELRGINMGSTFEMPEWKQNSVGENLSHGITSSADKPSKYSALMFDEVDERTINMDVLFGLLKELLNSSRDFKLILTTFPVEIFYTKKPAVDYLDAALLCLMYIHLTRSEGDILLFLTRQEEIDTACEVLNQRIKSLQERALAPE